MNARFFAPCFAVDDRLVSRYRYAGERHAARTPSSTVVANPRDSSLSLRFAPRLARKSIAFICSTKRETLHYPDPSSAAMLVVGFFTPKPPRFPILGALHLSLSRVVD